MNSKTLYLDNILWRIIGKRRKIKRRLLKQVNNNYIRLERQTINDAKITGYLETYVNHLKLLKDQYYDTSNFDNLLKQYYRREKNNG